MTFLKLFVKLFTSILLILIFTIQNNGSYQLQNNGAGVIYSIHGRWKEHGDAKFTSLMQTLNNHCRLYIKEDSYHTLFEEQTTKAVLKSNALDLVDEWYCRKMLDISNQVDLSLEATVMMTMVKKIPFLPS